MASIVNEVVALEPDQARWNYTRELVQGHDNVSVLKQTTQEYLSQNACKQFDFLVLGMVIQHLPTDGVDSVMADLGSLTKSGGIAVVSTTHALERARCFTYQKVTKGRLKSQISEEEFNRYAKNTDSQDKGLPVHRFSKSEFISIVPECFEVVQWAEYSYYRPEHLDYFAWLQSVDMDELVNSGNSQYLVLKKK